MGNVNGMTAVAQCFRNGVGVERDIQNANYWYRRANKLVTVVYECASKTIDFDYDLRKMLLENNYQLPWIPYEEFKNIIEIGKGGFATVYCASWDDKSRNVRTNVALKMLNLNEISVGQRPFDGVPFDKVLAAGICFGLRPEFALGTPNCYVELANQCMDPNPQKRPTTSVITDKLNKWFDSICAPPTVQDIETRALKNQFIEADRLIKELPTVGQKHLNHMYTSKLINTREITEKLLRIDAGSKLLYSINIPYYCGSQMQ
ncbi:kinase-like protein [Gigaspora margarita]|uniref:Kinase-like protein n=1 Tax=Gigaspora margarita TaxID=4874 RepID=A0A8H4AYB9_GIGMA|nr:kinase-like protein [Gigaspora margarita]